jgi:hypothetical protein
MATVHTITVKYIYKNEMLHVSYSFLKYKEFDKALTYIRQAKRSDKSNIVSYDWAFSNTIDTVETMLSFMRNTTDIDINYIGRE